MSSTTPPVRRFVVVSDFHMAGGRDERGCLARYEAFLQDDVFAALLDYIAERANAGRETCTLVLLGDFVDFLHTLPSAGREGSCTALVKLNRIARGHRAVFEALSDLRRRGCALAVVPGNHDIEFLEAAVQHRFLELVGARGTVTQVFYPWIYHVPGVLYAEHGSQYHDINAFPALLRAAVDNGLGAVPLGVHLSRYTVELLEELDAGDERPPELRRALRALAANPRRGLRATPMHARLIAAALAGSLPVGSRSAGSRARYRRAAIPAYASEIDLPADTVEALDRRAATSPWSPYRRTLRALAGRLSARSGRGTRSYGSADYLYRACQAIDGLLAQAGAAVPFYVFGHSHQPERVLIRPGGPTYLNAGTWSSMLPAKVRAVNPGGSLTFVDIEVSEGREATGELLRWDPAAGRPALATEAEEGRRLRRTAGP
jgi:UDP-2,3-diacylglucosamine pyrophosphatase LpxH